MVYGLPYGRVLFLFLPIMIVGYVFQSILITAENQGFNVYASAYFTGLNNGKISGIIALMRSFVIQTMAIFGLPLLMGAEGLWISQAAAEVISVFIAAALLFKYRRDYCGDNVNRF